MPATILFTYKDNYTAELTVLRYSGACFFIPHCYFTIRSVARLLVHSSRIPITPLRYGKVSRDLKQSIKVDVVHVRELIKVLMET